MMSEVEINEHLAPTLEYRVIYVYSRDTDTAVKGMLKIGEAVLFHEDGSSYTGVVEDVTDNMMKYSAKKRIEQQLTTTGAIYQLLHYELAIRDDGSSFKDNGEGGVHEVLTRSGIKKGKPNKGAQEWFECTLNQAKRAIKCVKEGKSYFSDQDFGSAKGIMFREEQLAFIKQANSWFKSGSLERPKEFLGNLKMRFGKTLTALQIAKENADISKVLIITHRPIVNDGWFEDFKKIFPSTSSSPQVAPSSGNVPADLKTDALAPDGDNWQYGSRTKGEKEDVLKSDKFVYFASIQDLRGSFSKNTDELELTKNRKIFNTEFDMVVIDEAHEGTQTELADKVMAKLQQKYILHLSGTPFNLVDKFDEKNTATWDYVDEQSAKTKWDEQNPEQSNPYADLPQLKMFTYDLKDAMRTNLIFQTGFKLSEFFRVDKDALQQNFTKHNKIYHYYPFVHQNDVMEFLNVISRTDTNIPTYFPYANCEFAEFLKDTLWLLPGVEECRSMEALLREHSYFRNYDVVNAAGTGTYEEQNALEAVKIAIGESPEKTYTITLSCGQLTTGVTVPAWTGVLMLNNMSSPSLYLQSAFRCQTPADIGGKTKTHCYVFDFDPDRCLSMAVAANQISKKPGEANDKEQRAELKNFLEFMPIVNASGAKLEPYDTDSLMRTLKRIYIEKAVENGFDTPVLYDQFALRKLTAEDVRAFNDMKSTVGSQQSEVAKKEVQVVQHNLAQAKLSSQELLKKGHDIINKAKSGGYTKMPSEKLLNKCSDALNELQKVVDKVNEFGKTYRLDNFKNLEKRLQDEYLNLQDELGVVDANARSLVKQVLKEVNSKEKIPPTSDEIQAQFEREQAKNAEAILRAVAVRIPLLVFGAEQTESITVDNFAELIDDASWEEFMPSGFGKISQPALGDDGFTLTKSDGEVIKPGWDYVKKFFAKDIFEGACKHIQDSITAFDAMPPLERVVHLANLFNTFKNPDKETVLTPFRVVNMQVCSTFGGLRFVDETIPHGKYFTNMIDESAGGEPLALTWSQIQATADVQVKPIWVNAEDGLYEREVWGKADVKILEPNSKTCLYPLFMAASLYAYAVVCNKLNQGEGVMNWINAIGNDLLHENDSELWREIIERNIFVNSRVEYSKKIAKRVLVGYREDIKPNLAVVDLIKVQKDNPNNPDAFEQELDKQIGVEKQ